MSTRCKNTLRPFVSLLFATLLTASNYLNLIGLAPAAPANKPLAAQKTDKVSPLKSDKHQPDETVTVIATLSGPRSGRLNAFLNKAVFTSANK
jgi:hypothetical protein